MSNPTIYNLLSAIRGLSNEITVRALACDLHVSTSTIMRCKSGVWPPSIAPDAIRAVLDDCRTRFFDGDGGALATSVLSQMRLQGVETEALSYAYDLGGYEAFVSELLMRAAKPDLADAADREATQGLGAPPLLSDASQAMRHVAERGRRFDELLVALPVVVILLIGLFELPLSSLFAWVVAHRIAFVAISSCIAVLPACMGVAIDAPLAWRAYVRRCPDATFSPSSFVRVAKYGDVEEVVPGAGRYNLSLSYLGYQVLCNVSGMLCYVSLFAFLLSLPGFASFFERHEWVEFFKVSIAVAFFVVYGHIRDQARRQSARVSEQARDVLSENPDNYRLSRAHVWANSIHLLWTVSLVFMLNLSMLAYSIVNFRTIDAPPLMLWPYMQAMVFFVWSCVSPQAIRIRATCIGAFLPSVSIVSLSIAALMLVCYRFSWGTVVVCVCCALCLLGALIWTRAHAHGADLEWLVQGRSSGAYMVVAFTSLACLLAIGMATSAFL